MSDLTDESECAVELALPSDEAPSLTSGHDNEADELPRCLDVSPMVGWR
jgi:hypothetical protein